VRYAIFKATRSERPQSSKSWPEMARSRRGACRRSSCLVRPHSWRADHLLWAHRDVYCASTSPIAVSKPRLVQAHTTYHGFQKHLHSLSPHSRSAYCTPCRPKCRPPPDIHIIRRLEAILQTTTDPQLRPPTSCTWRRLAAPASKCGPSEHHPKRKNNRQAERR
jgi:hypothetical protein